MSRIILSYEQFQSLTYNENPVATFTSSLTHTLSGFHRIILNIKVGVPEERVMFTFSR